MALGVTGPASTADRGRRRRGTPALPYLAPILAHIRFAGCQRDDAARPAAMHAKALAALSDVRARGEAFLADARSVLDRPLLADGTNPATEAFHRAYISAAATVSYGVPTEPCSAAE